MTEHPAVAEGAAAAERPVLRVVSGEATPEEIAAMVAAVAATTSTVDASSADAASGGMSSGRTTSTADGGSASRTTSLWSAPGHAHRNVRAVFTPGPDSWRTSFWPR